MALQRAVRLRKNGDFLRVRRQGRSIASRLLILAWAPNDMAQLRVGFVVSKRTSKHAVTRNYIKRLLAEAMRLLLPQIGGELDIVITARDATREASFQVIISDLTTLLRKAQLLKP